MNNGTHPTTEKPSVRYPSKPEKFFQSHLENQNNLLSLPTITALNLAVRVDVITDSSQKDILKQSPSLFHISRSGQPWQRNTTFSLSQKQSHMLYSLHVIYLYHALQAKVQQELDRIL